MTTEAPNPSPAGDDILAAIGAEPDPQRRERVKRVLDEHRAPRRRRRSCRAGTAGTATGLASGRCVSDRDHLIDFLVDHDATTVLPTT
ncbi:MAG: hypothetical protein ACRD0P_35105, partial [Stackebrandtia sp.]